MLVANVKGVRIPPNAAGRGITHSERTAPELRASGEAKLFGIQSWVALSAKDEENMSAFEHYDQPP